ncbi:phospholipid carrier-dependent glycosyltransferase [Leucobacter triazinivorans]|uniref:Polyprenol-phosphate-mannose--protein mannosyltransferase n=1 Tax=Leucobacter triazinivorans TaxID=1784719 RepID=A0A4P6KKR4_9MICO|nr:phospholipid carrier-dependent glycosyltransferase [Leucobacter triazinivorans]
MLGIAAILRFWALSRPDTLVFDELYYVRDAISQVAHGFPTVWPDADPDMSGSRATGFTDAPANAVHPPLGKWLIGLGVLLFGPGSGWGWRSAVALAGVATVAVVMRLGWLLSRSLAIACVAGLLLAVDGVHVVLTRVGLLDGLLTLFVALGALFVWRDGERTIGRGIAWRRIVWQRPWLLAAGAAFGAAAAIKWSGLYPLAFFLVYATVRDLLARLRDAREEGRARDGGIPADTRSAEHAAGSGATPGAGSGSVVTRATRGAVVTRTALQALVAAAIALPAAGLVYLASWAGWIVQPGGWGRTPGVPWPVALARYHAGMLDWHSTLSAPHPYQSHPLTWPLALVPTAMYESHWSDGCPWAACVAAISPLPNPLVTWGGAVALLVLAVIAIRRLVHARDPGRHAGPARTVPDPLVVAAAFVVTGYLSGWLPWVLTFSRSAVFQFYAVVLTPFSALALALLLGLLSGIPLRAAWGARSGARPAAGAEELAGRRVAVAIFLAAAVVLAALFFPVWSGMPVAEWFWRAHLWLPGWG